ncbi:hypothetical protein CLOM_g16187 [Closterium sp. NIES-68]|nr:hypothetical protein CLOM_g16187 [Closterium sp. NIES-68]GJP72299.1 hypothetical protein CLOP_g3046 [Closterium sp. NIES-67]
MFGVEPRIIMAAGAWPMSASHPPEEISEHTPHSSCSAPQRPQPIVTPGCPAGTATATAAASATVGHTVAAAGQWESSRGALEEMALTMRGSDGHCWLKYGQKQLSRQRHIIRCYYRCASHRSAACPVKKVVDTDMRPPVSPASISVSYSGGCHTHPQPLRPQPLHLPQQEANEQSVMQPVPPANVSVSYSGGCHTHPQLLHLRQEGISNAVGDDAVVCPPVSPATVSVAYSGGCRLRCQPLRSPLLQLEGSSNAEGREQSRRQPTSATRSSGHTHRQPLHPMPLHVRQQEGSGSAEGHELILAVVAPNCHGNAGESGGSATPSGRSGVDAEPSRTQRARAVTAARTAQGDAEAANESAFQGPPSGCSDAENKPSRAQRAMTDAGGTQVPHMETVHAFDSPVSPLEVPPSPPSAPLSPQTHETAFCVEPLPPLPSAARVVSPTVSSLDLLQPTVSTPDRGHMLHAPCTSSGVLTLNPDSNPLLTQHSSRLNSALPLTDSVIMSAQKQHENEPPLSHRSHLPGLNPGFFESPISLLCDAPGSITQVPEQHFKRQTPDCEACTLESRPIAKQQIEPMAPRLSQLTPSRPADSVLSLNTLVVSPMPAAAAAAAAADTRLTPCMRSTCAGENNAGSGKSHASSGNGDKAKRRKLKWPFGDVPCEQLVPTSTGHSGPPDSPSFGGVSWCQLLSGVSGSTAGKSHDIFSFLGGGDAESVLDYM